MTKKPSSSLPVLKTAHGEIALPAFLPDATRGSIRGVGMGDLVRCGIPGLVVNTYHLMLHPGSRTIKELGGCHAFMSWERPLLSDSGGFQVFSLLHRDPSLGVIRNDGAIFRDETTGKKRTLTPERCMQIQNQLGTDLWITLDDCTHSELSEEEQAISMKRTLAWAERCKAEFEKLSRKRMPPDRPLLFAVVQGGQSEALRRQCAEGLIEMDFDGYAFGGWPVDGEGNLLRRILQFTAELLPPEKPRYAMGVGKPENVVACARMGYQLFDCVIPTRDARHGRLFVFATEDLNSLDVRLGTFYRCLYLQDPEHIRNNGPISAVCHCECCRNHSLAYLHHLYQVRDGLALRLASLHNLRFYMQLMERIRECVPFTRPLCRTQTRH